MLFQWMHSALIGKTPSIPSCTLFGMTTLSISPDVGNYGKVLIAARMLVRATDFEASLSLFLHCDLD